MLEISMSLRDQSCNFKMPLFLLQEIPDSEIGTLVLLFHGRKQCKLEFSLFNLLFFGSLSDFYFSVKYNDFPLFKE